MPRKDSFSAFLRNGQLESEYVEIKVEGSTMSHTQPQAVSSARSYGRASSEGSLCGIEFRWAREIPSASGWSKI